MLCPFPGCGRRNNKMKRHVLCYHICHDRWWYLYPLLCCWTCKCWEIAIHVREHGPFQEDTHMGQLNNHVYEFLYFLTAALKLKSPQSLPLFVVKNRLGDGNSSFSEEEAKCMGRIRQVPKPAPTLREKHTIPHTHIFSFPLANSATAVTVDPPTNTGFSPPPCCGKLSLRFHRRPLLHRSTPGCTSPERYPRLVSK